MAMEEERKAMRISMKPTVFFLLIVLVELSMINNVKSDTNVSSLISVNIGIVFDMETSLGKMVDMCIKMAMEEFYLEHSNYTTRLKLHTKDVNTIIDANFAVQDLLRDDKVHGIIGPDGPMEDRFFAELGNRFHVPVISFTARTSLLTSTERHYSIRTSADDELQARALAEICRGFEWPQVVVLYEDTEHGNQFLSHLNKKFHEVEIGIAYSTAIPKWAEQNHLQKELNKLNGLQTRVYIVHMNPSLGYRLFSVAKRIGMMSEGYAWIITDSLSIFMSSMDPTARESMEGVVGIRPYIVNSEKLHSFQERWKENVILRKERGSTMELNIYGLWAYDTVCALAKAVEKVGLLNSSFLIETTKKLRKRTNFGISSIGPLVLEEISSTKFRGLQGDFELVDGKLKTTTYEIFNVFGNGEKSVGFWIPERGIVREITSADGTNYSTSAKTLKNIFWPGDSILQPKGWAIPNTGHLRVGVPKKPGFNEFVNLSIDHKTKHIAATGFAIDIFLASLDFLPFSVNYDFLYYNVTDDINWSYDNMLRKIPETYDMVVGDTTCWAPRAQYVDFSLPYSEGGVVLVVKNRRPFDMWIFIKPLKWDLWLAMMVSCIIMGVVLRILENQVTNTTEDDIQPRKKQPRIPYSSPVTVLAFPGNNMALNNWAVFVLVFWVFMAFILMQSYTANLSAILTVDQLKFSFSDDYYVGWQNGSFLASFLRERLHISESRLRNYSTIEDYHIAMTKGSKNGGIDAIFDELPYMKLFLKKYDSQYKMVGPTYHTGGLCFAFPLGSPLAAHFSKAILKVTQDPNMTAIEQKNFGPGYSSQDPLASKISQETNSLTLFDFAGLFIIVGSATSFALFFSVTPIGRKLTKMMEYYKSKYLHFWTSEDNAKDIIVVDEDTSRIGEVETEGIVVDEDTMHVGELEMEGSVLPNGSIGSEHEISECSSLRAETDHH